MWKLGSLCCMEKQPEMFLYPKSVYSVQSSTLGVNDFGVHMLSIINLEFSALINILV